MHELLLHSCSAPSVVFLLCRHIRYVYINPSKNYFYFRHQLKIFNKNKCAKNLGLDYMMHWRTWLYYYQYLIQSWHEICKESRRFWDKPRVRSIEFVLLHLFLLYCNTAKSSHSLTALTPLYYGLALLMQTEPKVNGDLQCNRKKLLVPANMGLDVCIAMPCLYLMLAM